MHKSHATAQNSTICDVNRTLDAPQRFGSKFLIIHFNLFHGIACICTQDMLLPKFVIYAVTANMMEGNKYVKCAYLYYKTRCDKWLI